jgi:hypothetical protein
MHAAFCTHPMNVTTGSFSMPIVTVAKLRLGLLMAQPSASRFLFGLMASLPVLARLHWTNSISLGRHCLVNNGSSGL